MAINFSEPPVQPYKAGDKYTIYTFSVATRASSSDANSVTVCIPIPKPSEAKGITAYGTITVRGADGSALATSVSFSVDGTVEEGFVRFSPILSYSQKPAAYAVVSAFLQNVTITFK